MGILFIDILYHCGIPLIVCSLLVLFCFHVSMSWQYKGEAQIRWSWLPYLGFALEMGSRPVELLKESGNMFGEIFGLIVAGNRMFFINDPHSASIILKPTKDLSFEEFHHSILVNFFGANQNTVSSHLLNEDLMRKWYSQYLLRYLVCPLLYSTT